ncbi:MAG TPA: hypothetical protein VMM13_05005 [Euzebya sp.]|nr:hypothetical protein [Euzebya sp.]
MRAGDVEPGFQIGAVHECSVAFRAMRDRFGAGEVLRFDQRLYSIHDAITGWLFTDPDGSARVWDVPDNPLHRTEWEHPADWDVLFRPVELDDARLVALQQGDLAGLQSLLVVDHRVTPALTLAGMHALRQHDDDHLVAAALNWLRPSTGLVGRLMWNAAHTPRQLAGLKGEEVARLFGWDLPAPPAQPGH